MIKIPGYTIHKKIGSGGMAVVYLATQDSLQRDVALKVMRNISDSDSNYKERFIHEGHDLASVEHPNIATIYDISHTDDYYYYAMEYLKGGSLSQRLDEGVSLVEAFNIIIQIGYALDCAHKNNIIHRDLKPSNILFKSDNTPVLTDFGIAKNVARETKLTKTGSLLGTPWYMSPEQCRGLPIDGRADLYSLAVLFFELITGYLPFDADDSIAIAMKQITEPVPLLPDNLSSLQSIFDIALDKEPNERFPTVADFCEVLKDKLESDELVRQHMNDMTQKISHEAVIHASSQAAIETLDLDLDLEHGSPVSAVDMPSEQEFWEQKNPIRQWFFYSLFLVTLVFGGQHYYFNYYVPQANSETARFLPVLMRQAERQISVSQIFEPAGNNAYETLTKILSMDPNYQPARLMLEDMATSYEIKARDYLLDKDFINAKKQIALGIMFSPKHQGLTAVNNLLLQALEDVEKKKLIQKKLIVVKSLYDANKYYKPENNNAMLEVNEILALNKKQSEALTYKRKIESFITLQFETKLKQSRGRVASLNSLASDITLALKVLPGSSNLLVVSQEINAEIEQHKKSTEVIRLIALAKIQLKKNKVYMPENDNAFLSYLTVLSLDSSNSEAKKQVKAIVNQLLLEAQKLYSDKKYTQALMIVEKALSADESNKKLLKLKVDINKRINENNDINQKRYSMASELIKEGKILFPKNDNAYDLIQAILLDNPDDVVTNQLLNSIPEHLTRKLTQLVANKEFSHVDKLYQFSLTKFPSNKKLLDLKPHIQEKKELAVLINEFDTLLALKKITTANILDSFDLLLKAQVIAKDLQLTSKGLMLLSNKLNEQLELGETIGSQREITDVNIELEMLMGRKLSDNDNYNDILGRVKAQLEKFTQIEKLNHKRSQLQVKVNALPWAKIVSLVDGKGHNVEVQENSITPLKLRLIPGVYQLVLSNPAFKENKKVDFTVSKGNYTSITAKFETLTANDYFKNSVYK